MKQLIEIQSIYGDLTCFDLTKVVAFQDVERDQSFIVRVWIEGVPKALDLNIAYSQFLLLFNKAKKKRRQK